MSFRLYRRALIEENKWRAARYGIEGKLIDFGKEAEVPMRELATELLEFVGRRGRSRKAAAPSNTFTILNEGTSAERQTRASIRKPRPEGRGRPAPSGRNPRQAVHPRALVHPCDKLMSRLPRHWPVYARLRKISNGCWRTMLGTPRRAIVRPPSRSKRCTHKRSVCCAGANTVFRPRSIARVNQLGKADGVSAEFVKLGGTRMNDRAEYSVIVDRISHEVEYYRGYLKHAVLQGAYVINNPWWTADDKFFNYSVAAASASLFPRRSSCRKRATRPMWISPRNPSTTCNIQSTGRSARLRRPPRHLKPYSGGGWKHVHKVNNREELLAAYDKTAPYCMTRRSSSTSPVVRCFTLAGNRHSPGVRYDPAQRRYLVEHDYLSQDLGARIVQDARTINQALGYEMNTIEFATGATSVPYAIDFLNPAPDFERDRITSQILAN